jgi:hypothetical protein
MNDISQELNVEHLNALISQARTQAITAILISLSMFVAILSFISTVINFKRLSLIFAFIYSILLCSIEVGFSKILGFTGCAISTLGFALSFKSHS